MQNPNAYLPSSQMPIPYLESWLGVWITPNVPRQYYLNDQPHQFITLDKIHSTNIPELDTRDGVSVHIIVISLSHPFVLLPNQTIACIGYIFVNSGFHDITVIAIWTHLVSSLGRTLYNQRRFPGQVGG
jgi:hypothetical protein